MGDDLTPSTLSDHLAALRAETARLTTQDASPALLGEADTNGQVPLRQLMDYYVTAERLPFELEDQVWLTVNRYLKYLIQATDTLLKSAADGSMGFMASTLTLKIESMATMATWHYLRYRPLPANFWRHMHTAYAQSERMHDAQTFKGHAAIRGRYLRVLLLDSINRSNLQKREIVHIDQWLEACCRTIVLDRQCNELKHLLFVDLTSDRSAQRIREYATDARCRYWSMETIIARLVDMRIQIEQGLVPAIFSQDTGLPNARRLLDQLSAEWSYQSYKRQRRTDAREEVAKLAQVVHGLMNVCQHVKNNAFNQLAAPMHNLLRPESSWRIENESKFGFGAQVNMGMNLWLKPGCLVSLDYEMNPDMIVVGVVRNLKQFEGADCYAGIEVLSHTPTYVTLRAIDGDLVTTASPALYLAKDDDRQRPASLIMAIYDYVPQGRYTLKMAGQPYKAALGELMEQQEDWVRVGVTIAATQA